MLKVDEEVHKMMIHRALRNIGELDEDQGEVILDGILSFAEENELGEFAREEIALSIV